MYKGVLGAILLTSKAFWNDQEVTYDGQWVDWGMKIGTHLVKNYNLNI